MAADGGAEAMGAGGTAAGICGGASFSIASCACMDGGTAAEVSRATTGGTVRSGAADLFDASEAAGGAANFGRVSAAAGSTGTATTSSAVLWGASPLSPGGIKRDALPDCGSRAPADVAGFPTGPKKPATSSKGVSPFHGTTSPSV